MDRRSAELTKYASNAMLAAKISFMNEVANIAEKVGADIEQVRLGVGTDRRIGPQFLAAGLGYGGSCFPKDVQALIHTAGDAGYDAPLIAAVDAVNRRQRQMFLQRIREYFDRRGGLEGRTICIWGLSFKPQTDDLREAPSLHLIEALWREGVQVRAFDPLAGEQLHRVYGQRDDLVQCQSALDAATGADALVVCTEWDQFRSPDFADLSRRLRSKVIFDGRNVYDPEQMRLGGWTYISVGRSAVRVAPQGQQSRQTSEPPATLQTPTDTQDLSGHRTDSSIVAAG
jgi:UDPglucose 6-dehydrogenase